MSALPTHFPPPQAPARPGLHFHAPSPEVSSHPPSESPPPTSPNPIPKSEIPPFLLTDLSNPSLSLRQVAEKHNTTVDALSVLLTDPAIAASIDALESTGARRARFVVSVSLTEVAGSLLKQLDAANADLDLASQANSSPIPNTFRGYIFRLRARESARKTAAALMSIARFHPGATKPRPESSSSTPSPSPSPTPAPNPSPNLSPISGLDQPNNSPAHSHPEEPAHTSLSPSRSEQEHDSPRADFATNPNAPSLPEAPTGKLASHESSTATGSENKLADPRSNEPARASLSPSRSEQTQVPSSPAGQTDSWRQRGADEWSKVSDRHPRAELTESPHAESVQLANNPATHPIQNSTSHTEPDFPDLPDSELTEQALAALASPVIAAINNSDPNLLANLSTHQAQSLVLEVTTEIALNDKLASLSDDQLLPLILTRLRHLLTQPSGP